MGLVPPPAGTSGVPDVMQARALAHALLSDVDGRWSHVLTAGRMAQRISILFDADEAQLLVAAATLHDVGYAPALADTGFHPLDGGLYLRSLGLPGRLAALVAHHSEAELMAPASGIHDLARRFPREDSLLADALVYADMHSAPDGRVVGAEERLADIAQRRPGPVEALRAMRLRAAMARVGAALEFRRVPQPRGGVLARAASGVVA